MQTAVALLRDWRPSVAVVDLEIPPFEGEYADEAVGHQLLQTIAELNKAAGTRTGVVVLTAFKKPASAAFNETLVVGQWLTKPVTCDALRSAISRVAVGSLPRS